MRDEPPVDYPQQQIVEAMPRAVVLWAFGILSSIVVGLMTWVLLVVVSIGGDVRELKGVYSTNITYLQQRQAQMETRQDGFDTRLREVEVRGPLRRRDE